jgi:hypothetical protein
LKTDSLEEQSSEIAIKITILFGQNKNKKWDEEKKIELTFKSTFNSIQSKAIFLKQNNIMALQVH